MYVKKNIFSILLNVIVRMEIYLANIMNDSAIICDEVTESHEGEINLNEKKAICKTQSLYILLAFLLIN